jgi:hypothetical protein
MRLLDFEQVKKKENFKDAKRYAEEFNDLLEEGDETLKKTISGLSDAAYASKNLYIRGDLLIYIQIQERYRLPSPFQSCIQGFLLSIRSQAWHHLGTKFPGLIRQE